MKTLHLRLKDKHAKLLDELACEVNFTWNYINELCYKHLQRTGKFFSSYDIQKYTAGATKEGLKISCATVQMVGAEYVTRRRQFRKAKLRWRASYGKRKALGWIPFRSDVIKYVNGQIKYKGYFFSFWDSYGLSKYKLGSGNFSQDNRGRWYANICVEPEVKKSTGTSAIGIDLGLKEFLTTSDGFQVDAQQFYRKEEPKIKRAQRARNKKQVKNLHAKVKNRRKDFLHKLSTRLVRENGAIFVGDVNPTKLAKTNLAKSIYDAGWSTFRNMLKYKCDYAGVIFEVVNEAYSTQTCSSCGCRSSPERPKGTAGLGIREWTCTECGTHHDRDVNAARNILAVGLGRLAEEILV